MRCQAGSALLLILLVACGGDGTGPVASPAIPETAAPFEGYVSEPIAIADVAGSAIVSPAAWVSAPPGTEPAADAVWIENERTGERVSAVVSGGGFDPVSVPAAAGDPLRIAFHAGTTVVNAKADVPSRRRPRVVRTSPSRGQRDVALNASIVVVFSEPIARTSVKEGAVTLRAGDEVVSGTVAPVTGALLAVTFTPAAPLAASTSYEIVIAPTIVDGSGDALETPEPVAFSTRAETLPREPSGRAKVRLVAWGLSRIVTRGEVTDPVLVTVTNVGFRDTDVLETRYIECGGWFCTEPLPPDADAPVRVTEDECAGRVLEPHQGCTLRLALAPVEEYLTYSLRVDGSGHELWFEVFGVGLWFDPPYSDFGEMSVGDSLTTTLTVGNSAAEPTGPISVELPAGPFSIIPGGDDCSGRALDPDAACSISVRYAPESAGFHAETLRLHAMPGGPASLQVSGLAR